MKKVLILLNPRPAPHLDRHVRGRGPPTSFATQHLMEVERFKGQQFSLTSTQFNWKPPGRARWRHVHVVDIWWGGNPCSYIRRSFTEPQARSQPSKTNIEGVRVVLRSKIRRPHLKSHFVFFEKKNVKIKSTSIADLNLSAPPKSCSRLIPFRMVKSILGSEFYGMSFNKMTRWQNDKLVVLLNNNKKSRSELKEYLHF